MCVCVCVCIRVYEISNQCTDFFDIFFSSVVVSFLCGRIASGLPQDVETLSKQKINFRFEFMFAPFFT